MEAHYRAGEQEQALRAFERCRVVLGQELGIDPLPETLALHQRILQTPPQVHRAPAPALPPSLSLHLPFVGREREWALLNGLLQRAMDGQGCVALLAGEPGIGKTRLLEELAGLATARGSAGPGRAMPRAGAERRLCSHPRGPAQPAAYAVCPFLALPGRPVGNGGGAASRTARDAARPAAPSPPAARRGARPAADQPGRGDPALRSEWGAGSAARRPALGRPIHPAGIPLPGAAGG